jgi:hypothetical protein
LDVFNSSICSQSKEFIFLKFDWNRISIVSAKEQIDFTSKIERFDIL